MFDKKFRKIMEEIEKDDVKQIEQELQSYLDNIEVIEPNMSESTGYNMPMVAIALAMTFFGMSIDEAEAATKVSKGVISAMSHNKKIMDRIKSIGAESVIALTLNAEAANQGKTGIDGVASVIANRCKEYNRSAAEICLQRKQFTCWNRRVPKAGSGESWAYCLKVAKELNAKTFKPTLSYNAYYDPKNATPDWAYNGKQHVPYKQLGAHRFLNTELPKFM